MGEREWGSRTGIPLHGRTQTMLGTTSPGGSLRSRVWGWPRCLEAENHRWLTDMFVMSAVAGREEAEAGRPSAPDQCRVTP